MTDNPNIKNEKFGTWISINDNFLTAIDTKGDVAFVYSSGKGRFANPKPHSTASPIFNGLRSKFAFATVEPKLNEVPTDDYIVDFVKGYHFDDPLRIEECTLKTSLGYMEGMRARQEDDRGNEVKNARVQYNRIQSNRVNIRKGGE